jgi:CDP-diacylglycerol--glycerol-3-phosphate 3-phosphatidyltransferase
VAHSQSSSAPKIWTPANIVTVIRICLVPVFVVVLLSPWPEWFGVESLVAPNIKSCIAAGLFILISCTDWIDGYLARSRGEVTDFGKFMDPLADKILVAAALLALIELGVLPAWPVLIILTREFIVSGVRMMAAAEGEVIAASMYGKFKTVFQIIAIVLFLIKDILLPVQEANQSPQFLYILAWIVMVVALILTIVSMVDYVSKARHLFGFARKVNKKKLQANSATEDAQHEIVITPANVIDSARSKGLKISCAESLTGGLISAELTSVSGSSDVFLGGIVSYAISAKNQLLDVDSHLLSVAGAVDGRVAEQMAKGSAEKFGADIAVAVTGIAGPGGQEPGKPVGTVWFGVCVNGKTTSEIKHFDGSREDVRQQTVTHALELFSQNIQNC